jgi:hypothetical protein
LKANHPPKLAGVDRFPLVTPHIGISKQKRGVEDKRKGKVGLMADAGVRRGAETKQKGDQGVRLVGGIGLVREAAGLVG